MALTPTLQALPVLGEVWRHKNASVLTVPTPEKKITANAHEFKGCMEVYILVVVLKGQLISSWGGDGINIRVFMMFIPSRVLGTLHTSLIKVITVYMSYASPVCQHSPPRPPLPHSLPPPPPPPPFLVY